MYEATKAMMEAPFGSGYNQAVRKSRKITVHTWDYGDVTFDPYGDRELTRRLLQKFLDNGMWDEIRKIPPRLIGALAPRLDAPRWSRRFLLVCAREWA